jgi:hypothetical protein
MPPWPNNIKCFTFVNDKCLEKARVFDSGKSFQPNLMFYG